VIYVVSFWLADWAHGDARLPRFNIGKHVGKLMVGGLIAINGGVLGAILLNLGR
jgi:hypothetical protein